MPVAKLSGEVARAMPDVLLLAGRLAVVVVVLVGALGKWLDLPAAAAVLARQSVPAPVTLATFLAYVEVMAALALAVGVYVAAAARVLALVTGLGVVLTSLPELAAAAPGVEALQALLRDIAVLGGLALLHVAGPGRYAWDSPRDRRRSRPRPAALPDAHAR